MNEPKNHIRFVAKIANIKPYLIQEIEIPTLSKQDFDLEPCIWEVIMNDDYQSLQDAVTLFQTREQFTCEIKFLSKIGKLLQTIKIKDCSLIKVIPSRLCYSKKNDEVALIKLTIKSDPMKIEITTEKNSEGN